MRILALDYGAERTGAAVCDPTETVVRPVGVIRKAASQAGMAEIAALVAAERVGLVVVGVPVSLTGGEHGQARRSRAFAKSLAERLRVRVTTYDERFTTKVAATRGGSADIDARAAAVLLEDYLRARRVSTASNRLLGQLPD